MKAIIGLILAVPLLTSCAPGSLWSNASAVSACSYHAIQSDRLTAEGAMVLKQQLKMELQQEGVISSS